MPQSTTHNTHVSSATLAADVGGTKTLLQLRLNSHGQLGPVVAEQRYPSADYATLENMVADFLADHPEHPPASACFAVAGPVQQQDTFQQARLTNLPWQLDTRSMSERLGIARIALLNDFQAIGYSLDELGDDELAPLQSAPAVNRAPRLVVGAGTGLGVCTLCPDGDDYISYPTEGGHIAFAPTDEQQLELLRFLQAEYGRVSCERLLSGSGLGAIYRFLLQRRGGDDTLLQQADPAAAIGTAAMAGSNPLALQAVSLFSRIYGATVGDLALASLPAGGVFIAGGIAPKLLPFLQNGSFVEAFCAKGRMSELMHGLPLQVITNPQAGLLGAAHFAARL